MRRAVLVLELAPLLGELTRFAQWLSGTSDDADELVQETLVRALKAEDRLENPGALRAWLFRIARNAHVDLRRRDAAQHRFVVLEGGLDELSALESEAGFELPAAIDPTDLERELMRLPESARVALLLTDLWEFDHDEVARILVIPVGTVKSRVARARARLVLALGGRTSERGRRA